MAYAAWRAQRAGLVWGFDDMHIDEARNICRRALAARGDGWLTLDETHAVLRAFTLPLAAGDIRWTADEAATLASELGFPVAAKLASQRAVHKSEMGAVRLNLTTPEEVREAFRAITASLPERAPADHPDGVLIQPMVVGGIEEIVGVTADPVFGALVGFGLGGTHVEILGDMRFRIAPLTDDDADELLHEGRGFPLLQGYRGRPAADVAALREVVLPVSRLAEAVPEISELDVNPVMVLAVGNGCRVVDARIKVAVPRRPSRTVGRSHFHGARCDTPRPHVEAGLKADVADEQLN